MPNSADPAGVPTAAPLRGPPIRGLVRVALLAAALALVPHRPADAADESAPPSELDVRAAVLSGPLEVDGDLADWVGIGGEAEARMERRDQVLPDRTPGWEGPADLSAAVRLAVHGTDLYFGVSVEDELRLHDPAAPYWHGDSLEVFLDFDRTPSAKPGHEYTDGCIQLFLMPLNPELAWSVVFRGKEMFFDDAGLRGVVIAHRERIGGYDFEARIPLSNFGVESTDERVVGLALALNDADEAPSEPGTYLSWNAGFDLWRYPDHFGTLTLPARDAPVAPAPSRDEGRPLWVFVLAVIAIGVVLVLAGPGARWLAETGPRPKWIGLGLVTLLALVLYVEDRWSETRARDGLEGELEDLAATAAAVAADARAIGAFDEPAMDARSERLAALLAGGSIPCKPGVEAVAFVPLQPGGTYADGLPKRYRIDLDRPQDWPLPEPVDAARFVVTLERPTVERARTPARDVGVLAFESADGARAEAHVVLDPDAASSTHAIEVDLGRARPWTRVRWTPGAGARGALLREIATDAPPARSPLLLPAPTEEGIPVLAHAGGLNHGRAVPPGESETFPIPALLGGADRLWVVLTVETGFPDLLGDLELVRLTVTYEDGPTDTRLLRNGEHLAAERVSQGMERPAALRSRVAYRWDSALGYTFVHDAVPVRLATERRPRTLTVENLGPGGTVDVLAASVVRTRRAADDSRVHVVADGREPADQIHLVEGVDAFAARLTGDAEGAVTLERRIGSGPEALELFLSAPLPDDVVTGRDRTTALLLACLAVGLILLVLLAVDAADRFPRLARRLSFGVLVAALVPLAVTILLVDRTHTERVSAEVMERAKSGLSGVGGRLDEALYQTQRTSRWLARDLATAGKDRALTDVRRLVEVYAARTLPEGASGSAIVVGADIPPDPVPLSATGRPLGGARLLPAAREPGGYVVSAWDGLVLIGAARRGDGENRVRVALGVKADDALLERVLGDVLRDAGASVVVLDADAHVLARAGRHGVDLGATLAGRAESLRRRLAGGGVVLLPGVSGPTHDHLAAATRIATAGPSGAGAWIAVGFDEATVHRAVGEQRETLTWLAVFGLVLMVSVASLMARRVAKPVGDLLAATEAVRQGSFDVVVPRAGADEVGQLTVAFDQMRLDLKHRVGDLDFLRAAQNALSSSLDLGDLAETVLDRFVALVGADRGVLLDAEGRGTSVYVLAQHGEGPKFGDRAFAPAVDGWIAAALSGDAPVFVRHTDAAATAEGGPGLRLVDGLAAWAAVPLVLGGERQGVVVLGFPEPSDLPTGEGGRLLVPLAGVAAAAMNNARLYRLAALDDVTRLPGATAFEAALRGDVERALLGGPTAVLLRVGIDHLEHVILRRGVEPARRLMAVCASALRNVVADRSHLGRLREDQLAVRLPGADAETIRQVAETIRERMAAIEVSPDEGGDALTTTVSIGMARAPDDAQSVEFLLDAAGRALTAAQREGGDAVEDVSRLDQGAVDMPPFEEGAIFRNERMVRVVDSARRAARSDASILITGETGTGKEVIATLVHRRSVRAERPFVTVNCAAFPETLLESELFGHERGAFTGAERRREGRFELADGGTLFLDEIAEMTPSAQVRLLRVLQERQFTRLGGTRTIAVDVRIIAATNRDLERAVSEKAFREDLYYRLNVIRLELPPLRERREEIPFLVEKFLTEFRRRSGRGPRALTPAAMDVLYRHPWPGNVRELKNAIERCAVLCESDVVGPEHLHLDGMRPSDQQTFAPRSAPQDDLNPRQRALLEYLARHGRCTNRVYTEMTGTSQRTALRDLQDLMKRGLIVREGSRRGAVYRLK